MTRNAYRTLGHRTHTWSAPLLAALLIACGGSDKSGVAADTGGVTTTSGPTTTSTGSGGASTSAGPSTSTSSGGSTTTQGATVTTTGGMFADTVECMGDLPSEVVSGATHSVTVNSASSWGSLPHFWNTYGTGHLGLFLRDEGSWGQILQDAVADGVQNLGMTSIRSHGLFHDDIGIYSENNGTPVYDFTNSDVIFDFLVGQGIEPIIELGPMPSALASNPSETVFDWDMGISPPKDFTLWQELVYQFAQHSIDRYGADVVGNWYWEVWNEPECCSGKFWSGTLEQYFELYDHSVAGVLRADPNGRVGGPVSSQPIELTENSMAGQRFLEHVTTDNYLNPGNPGRLDFFAYHSWSFIDGSINGYFQALDLLSSFGLNVPVAITEFGPTWQFNLMDEPQEMTQGAAFVAQTFSDISRRAAQEGKRFPLTYSWWVVSDVFEEETYREDEPFIGCMGLISREGIHKPAYNAYKFLAQMGIEQVELNVEGAGNVGGMAARSADGGVQVIVYNAQNPGLGPTDDVYYQQSAAQDIGVTISGLDPEISYDVASYRVDADHGNAYGVWQSMGRPNMPSMSEADWQALRDAMDSPEEPIGQALCGETFSQTFSLASPGVLFIDFTPAVVAGN